MSYKSIVILFFSIFFMIMPTYAAIPILPEKPNHVQKVRKHFSIFKKWPKKDNPNKNGLLSLIFGVSSILLFPPLAIPAIILGAISLSKKEPETIMPIIGLITGGLVILATIFLLVIFLIVLA